jgi:L-galactose dehydrogenase
MKPLPYTILGRTGLKVSRMALGCGGLNGLGRSEGRSKATSTALIRQALDAGVNLIDTAEIYDNEHLVGEALRGRDRASVVVSTKISTFSLPSPAKVRKSLEDSLKRLGLDYIDIYHLHSVNAQSYENLLVRLASPLKSLQAQGKIRFLGLTERSSADPFHTMFQRALHDDLWDVIMVAFNVLNQTARDTILPKAIEQNRGVLVMCPARAFLNSHRRLAEQGRLSPRQQMDREALLSFLSELGGPASMTKLAYRYCLNEPGVHSVLTGTANSAHLAHNLAIAAQPMLPPELTRQLHALFSEVDPTLLLDPILVDRVSKAGGIGNRVIARVKRAAGLI